MNLDITVDNDSEEVVMVVDDHQVIKFGWDNQKKVIPDKKARALGDEDEALYDTLQAIALKLFNMSR